MSDLEKLAGLLGAAMADVALLERRVEQIEQTVRAHAVVSDARWDRLASPGAVQTRPGVMTFTVLEKE